LRRRLRGVWLGRRRYQPVYELQQQLHELRRRGAIGETVLLLEHDPVITIGRGGQLGHVLASQTELAERGVELLETNRGGDVTLHAPGQIVCYPIVDLSPDRRDVRRYVRDLTETMRRVVCAWDLDTGVMQDLVGLWVDQASPGNWNGKTAGERPAKLGAIGVRISRWVTMHGFALNLNVDLGLYSLLVPCGITQFPVTSVHALSGQTISVRATAPDVLRHLGEVLDGEAGELEDAEHDTWSDVLARVDL
jgi:lipoyl(octanoyl) transferase